MPRDAINKKAFETDRDAVHYILHVFGPCSDHAIRHIAKAIGHPMTDSSARTRRKELGARAVGAEKSSTGVRAYIWEL